MIYDVITAIDENLRINNCNGSDLTQNLWDKLSNHISIFEFNLYRGCKI